MSYYDDAKNVERYIDMAQGYDGKVLINVLRQYVSAGATVLELGMGPGKDLLLLGEHFTVTGSDRSTVFLDRFRAEHPDADLLQLDAATIELPDATRRFDAIYSNKVLYHLSRAELVTSLQKQAGILKPGGIALHSFWYGDGDEEMHGLHFAYYEEDALREVVGNEYDIVRLERYTEDESDDSLYMVLKARSQQVEGE